MGMTAAQNARIARKSSSRDRVDVRSIAESG